MFKVVDSEKFTKIKNQMPETFSVFLTEYNSIDYKNIKAVCFLSNDKKSGFAIKPDGDLISLFSLPGASQGNEAIKSAIKNGATKLDCIGEFLVSMYNKFGFAEIKRESWNNEYAPKNWDYKTFGKPDIVYMELE